MLRKGNKIRVLVISALLLLCCSSNSFSQTVVAVAPSKRTAVDILPDKLGDLSATGRAEAIEAAQLNAILGQDVDLAHEYGIDTAATRIYKSGTSKTSVAVLQLDQASRAYGLYRALSSKASPIDSFPPRGQITDKGLIFWQGRYLVLITDAATSVTDEVRSERKSIANALSDRIGNVQSEDPGIMRHLPDANRIGGSEKYIVGPVGLSRFTQYGDPSQINFEGGTEIASADYDWNGNKGQLMIVEFQTPQFATQGVERMQKYIDSLPPAERSRIFLKREGNYGVQTIGFNDKAVAESLADKVKYTYTVKWITKPPVSPFDLSSYRKDALRLIIAIFVVIGIAVVIAVGGGVLFGRWLFVRRRAQLKNVFSDAGGMIRLNLDDMVNPSLTESHTKLLGDGD